MKRRTKGTGTIIKVGDVYYGRINVNGKVKKVRLSKNQREAVSLWNDWLRENINTFRTETVVHPITDVWPMLEEHYLGQGKTRKTIDEIKSIYTRFSKYVKECGKKSVEDITKSDIIQFIEEKCEGLADRTKRGYKYFIRDMFRVICPSVENPADNIRVRKTKTLPREPFTDDELDTILAVAEKRGHSWKVLIEVGLYTGLRLKDCVYLHTGAIQDGVIMTTPFKTSHQGTEVRIPLHPVLRAELASLGVQEGYYFPDLIEIYQQRRMEMRLRFIFNHIQKELNGRVEGRKRKVPLKGFHALRATFITRLAEKGVSLPIMESLAGHLNPQMTLHYTHPDEDVKKSAIDVLGYGVDEVKDDNILSSPVVARLVEAFDAQLKEAMTGLVDGRGEDIVRVKKEILKKMLDKI